MRPGFCRQATLLTAIAGVSALALGGQADASSLPTPRERAVLGPTAALLVGPARIASSYGVVTSGFRTVAHNRAVGGMPNSYHLSGRAIDVARAPGVTHRMIDAALRGAGFVLVESLDEGDHSHFAFGTALPVRQAPPVVLAERPAPAKPLPPRLLADEHGTLLVDSRAPLANPAPSSGAAVIGVQAAR